MISLTLKCISFVVPFWWTKLLTLSSSSTAWGSIYLEMRSDIGQNPSCPFAMSQGTAYPDYNPKKTLSVKSIAMKYPPTWSMALCFGIFLPVLSMKTPN